MSIVFKILHIPSGSFITAFGHSGVTTEAIFYDPDSAVNFLDLIKYNTSYISGGPIMDFHIGKIPIVEYNPIPILSEFELLPFELDDLPEIEQHRILNVPQLRERYVDDLFR